MLNRRWRNADLARALNISPQQVGKYISGKYEPKMETLVMFAKFFDVTIDDLVLVDFSKETPDRKYGSGVEAAPTTDEQLTLMNKLLLQRVQVLEREIKEDNPDLARELGIE
ncbi:MAG: helix-turn-helix transcriptional regulator [Bacteroidota bacterium]